MFTSLSEIDVAGADAAHSPNEVLTGETWSTGDLAMQMLCSRELVFLLVGVGILLRVAQYLANRSLWVDEAWLALNFIERPLRELTTPLSFQQAAPVGFLFVEGTVAKTLGFSEYALRLFPLLSGLVSLPAFAWLARRILSAPAAPFAIFLFGIADALIYYSSEVKPYETDVAVAVSLLAAGTLLAENAVHRRRTAFTLSVAGLAIIALSFPAAFVVAAVSGVLAARLLFDRRRLHTPASLVVPLWGTAAIALAVFGGTRAQLVRASFAGARFLGVTSSSSPLHALNVMGTQIAAAIGLPQQRPFNQLEKLALLCCVVGAIALLRRHPAQLSMMVLPFPLLFGASAAHIYPISERTDLFLVPTVVLFLAEGVVQAARSVPDRGRAVTALLLAVAVGAGPVWLAGARLARPRSIEEIKPVLEFVRDNWRPGDALYVHYGAQYALLYYEECDCLRLTAPHSGHALWPLRPREGVTDQYGQAAISLTPNVRLGRSYGGDKQAYVHDLDPVLKRRRVWFLYSHVAADWEVAIVQESMLRHLASLGKRIDGIDRTGAHAYLYRLNAITRRDDHPRP